MAHTPILDPHGQHYPGFGQNTHKWLIFANRAAGDWSLFVPSPLVPEWGTCEVRCDSWEEALQYAILFDPRREGPVPSVLEISASRYTVNVPALSDADRAYDAGWRDHYGTVDALDDDPLHYGDPYL